MASWAIVGAARGIGFEYVQQLSSNPDTTVFALIRSQKTAGPLNELASARKNIHVLETDTSNPSSLQAAAEKAGAITGGKLDVLIYNAFLSGTDAQMLTPTAFVGKEQELQNELFETIKVNVIQQIYAINAFLPLIRQGSQKKIIYTSTGMGDIDVIRVCEIPPMLGYSVSKAAGNIIISKYSAELKSEGIKTLALSPGWVATDSAKEQAETPGVFDFLLNSFRKMDPNVTGMITTEESVKKQLKVIHDLDEKTSGMFLSQNGNHEWF